MRDWAEIVTRNHEWEHAHDGYQLVTQAGVSLAAISELEDRFGVSFPDEFGELYGTFDGIGVRSDVTRDDTYWLFRPIEDIPQFADLIRSCFQYTHPKLAARFFPFIDWANSDGMGYVVDANGTATSGLYTFEHEKYDHDEQQEIDEFLSWSGDSIEEFLNAR